MSPDDWFTAARLDAERRNLSQVASLLAALHPAVTRLRAADWNDDLRPARPRVEPSARPRP